MPRKNSKDFIDNYKKERSVSLSSYDSIETISLDDDTPKKNRRKREVNIETRERRITPDILTIRKMLDYFRDSIINK